MHQSIPVGSKHAKFIKWVKGKGVEINGVKAASIPTGGIGLFARRRIEIGEELVKVPSSALLSIGSVPRPFRKSIGKASVNGIIAAFLAFGGDELKQYDPWKASWPSMKDFQTSTPLLWPVHGRSLMEGTEKGAGNSLPFPITIGGRWIHEQMQKTNRPDRSSILSRQKEKLNRDWALVSKAIPNADIEQYTYYWFVVNTRSFYYEFPDQKLPNLHDDRIVMVPYMDYFNHNEEGCNVSFDKDWYSVTSDRVYEQGEEIHTSYGNHSNDFLLVEYGFFLSQNKWDALPLDDFFTSPKIPESKRTQLKIAGYLGNYSLDSSGVCYRTQVAVRSQTMNLARWKQFVQGRDPNPKPGKIDMDAYICRNILLIYHQEVVAAIKILEAGDINLPTHIQHVLLRRWRQIREMIISAFCNGIDTETRSQFYQEFDLSEEDVSQRVARFKRGMADKENE